MISVAEGKRERVGKNILIKISLGNQSAHCNIVFIPMNDEVSQFVSSKAEQYHLNDRRLLFCFLSLAYSRAGRY